MPALRSLFAVPAPRRQSPPRVGRLVPVEGITVREHPDRVLLMQVLQELRLPLSAIDSFLELVEDTPVQEPVRQVLDAVADNVRHLGELVADYREFAQLEADTVQPRPATTSPLAWLAAIAARHQADAERHGVALRVLHRSFLPAAVEFDADLAARALDATARVSLHRALPGPMVWRVAYHAPTLGGGPARLCIDIETRGGGFHELERGYAFAPFAASDAAERPLLGLSVARRLCHLLGGELRLDSRGPASCTYRVAFAAPACAGSPWIDPLQGG